MQILLLLHHLLLLQSIDLTLLRLNLLELRIQLIPLVTHLAVQSGEFFGAVGPLPLELRVDAEILLV